MLRIVFAIIIGGMGTGIGYGLGWLGGITTSGITSGIFGMCTAVDVGVDQGLLTPTQAEQVGTSMAKEILQKGQSVDSVKFFEQIDIKNPSAACQQFRQGMSKAIS
ncbi:MAG: hypothetical protein MUF49_23310 [Oculatellaceae cyanobacterium Prado106]|jgi:hypothetical protein|nr:hypothetical protein [Oculatellaceae cyanobacterium Prado106]